MVVPSQIDRTRASRARTLFVLSLARVAAARSFRGIVVTARFLRGSLARLIEDSHSVRRGVVAVLAAYTMWGVFPLYFRLLRAVPPFETLLHRLLWSAVFLSGVLAVRRSFAGMAALKRASTWLNLVAAALLLSANWFVYIWAISNDRVVDASLGYYMSPLLNVALGALFFRESLRRLQWIAVAISALGVLFLTFGYGELPWVGLSLALSWGGYGVLRKISALPALESVTLETVVMLPISAAYLGVLLARGDNHLVIGQDLVPLLLVVAGPVTAAPLLLFGSGVRRVPLSVVGVLQYIQPTLQLAIGVVVFGEAFPADKAIGYACIWFALLLFSGEGLWVLRRRRAPGAP
jgi:chloramphenicol-sensitive protein RarD